PAFVVMLAGESGRSAAWSSGFLPPAYQGTVTTASGIPNVAQPADVSPGARRAQLDLIGELNARHRERNPADDELEARIRSYELAFRMQTAAPEAFDLARETAETKRLYGLDDRETSEFGTMCLLARRLVERGVRFVQLRSGGWDAHGDLAKNHTPQARKT